MTHPDDAEPHFDPAILQQDQRLTTGRTLLLPIATGDEAFLYPHMADPAIADPMSWSPHSDPAETKQVVRRLVTNRANGAGITWCIYRREALPSHYPGPDDKKSAFAGVFSLIDITSTHRSLRYDKAELAYWLTPAHQGQGLMSEVGHCIVEHAYSTLYLHKLVVGHMDSNRQSRALIERLGFRRIGVERAHFKKDGRWHDHHIYEMLAYERPAAS